MDTTNRKIQKEEVHHGRYNEPSPVGTDAYGIRDKAMEHMASLKKIPKGEDSEGEYTK